MYKIAAYLNLTLIVLAHCLLSFAAEEKLNIGVKKRVKDCKIKSQNGDTLHMHYTVRDVELTSLKHTNRHIKLIFLQYRVH